MSDVPFRLRTLVALTECLERINPDNGFADFDMRGSVFRGASVYGDNDPLPMISIMEPPIPEDPHHVPDGSTDSYNDWTLLLQGFVKDDPKHPTDPAYYLLAHAKTVLSEEIARKTSRQEPDILGMGRGANCITRMTIGNGGVRPADEFSVHAYFWLTLTLKIVEDNTNPFG